MTLLIVNEPQSAELPATLIEMFSADPSTEIELGAIEMPSQVNRSQVNWSQLTPLTLAARVEDTTLWSP